MDKLDKVSCHSLTVRWKHLTALEYISDGNYGAYFPNPDYVENDQTFHLRKINTNANDVLQGPQAITTQNNFYKAFSSLTVSNGVTFTSTSSADLTAMNEVDVQTEFHAANGSEVHIYN